LDDVRRHPNEEKKMSEPDFEKLRRPTEKRDEQKDY
jgi:hypothetical protein